MAGSLTLTVLDHGAVSTATPTGLIPSDAINQPGLIAKSAYRYWFCLLSLLLLFAAPGTVSAFETSARAAIVLDFRTGEVLFEKNADEALPPASMSKLMTAYIVFERIKEGLLALDDTFIVSERAWRMGGSQMFLEVGDEVRLDDLLRGIIIQSGNDACVVVSEAVAGSEEAFADVMNRTGEALGLQRSSFKNSTGLDEPGHLMSVRDLSILARRIIERFPELYSLYSEKSFTYNDIEQFNRNPLLRRNVQGVDGMKTGFTDDAGYGLVASAERDGRRLIVVVSGVETAKLRATESQRLLEYGFRNFQEYRLFEAGAEIGEADVWLGKSETVPLVARDLVAVTLSREDRRDLQVKLVYNSPIEAPVEAGQNVGQLRVTAPGDRSWSLPVVAGAAVEEAGMIGRIKTAVNHLVWGGS